MIPKTNVCIDYFKLECVHPFKMDEFVLGLFKKLRLNPWRFDLSGAKQFGEVRIYGCNTRFMLHPDGTAERKDGMDYFIVEMSGSACRDFESRNGNWGELLRFVRNNASFAYLKRCDIALDDLFGFVPLDELKRRLSKDVHLYITKFRKFRFSVPSGRNDGTIEDSFETGDDGSTIIEGQGWSATWGTKSSALQLQIYDKLAEREANFVDVSLKHWVRFEMRFLHYYAKNIIFPLCKAFESNTVGEFAHGLLKGMLSIIDNPNGEDRNHLYRCPLWKPYDEFLGKVEGIRIPANQDKVEVDAVRRVRYLHDNVGSTLKALALVDPSFLLDELGRAIVDSIKKNGVLLSDMSKANRYRKSYLKSKPLEDNELLENLNVFLSMMGKEMPKDFTVHKDYSNYGNEDDDV